MVGCAFNPIKEWLQRIVNHRLGGATSFSALDQFGAAVETVVSVMDVRTVACHLVDQAYVAYSARGVALFLTPDTSQEPSYSRGQLGGDRVVDVELRYEDHELGRLVLAGRRGGVVYSQRDVAALQRSANAVGKALALAARTGVEPLARISADGVGTIAPNLGIS